MNFMKIVSVIYTSTNIFTDKIKDYVLAQIRMLCNNQAFEGCRVRIMPNVHWRKIGTIRVTSTVGKKVLLGVVGVNVDCGITIAMLKQKKVRTDYKTEKYQTVFYHSPVQI